MPPPPPQQELPGLSRAGADRAGTDPAQEAHGVHDAAQVELPEAPGVRRGLAAEGAISHSARSKMNNNATIWAVRM